MSNRISVVLDVATTQAISSLKNFKTAVSDADGVVGKTKAGITSAFDGIKQNLAGFALAAGASIAAWGVKAVTEFQNTALEAGKFADAVGVSVEDASRWLEVAGDFGVKSSGIEDAMLKFNKALGAGKIDLEDWGGQLIRAKDGTIDANASFQDAVTKIGAIEDPTKRALAAQEAFGKGYKEIAELMELDADELRAALDNVSEAKVIDEEELGKAREFRAALDELKDRFEDVTLWVGERLVPVLLDAAENLEAMAGPLVDLNEQAEETTGIDLVGWLSKASEWANKLFNPVKQLSDQWDKAKTAFGDTVTIDGLGEAVVDLAEKTADLGDDAVDTGGHIRDFSADTLEAKEAAEDAEQAVSAFDDSIKKMLGEVNAEQAWLDIKQKMDGHAEAMMKAKGNADEERLAVLSLKESMLEYVGTLEGVPLEKKTEIRALIDEENFRLVEVELAKLEKSRFPVYTPVFRGGNGPTNAYGAEGGIVTRPTLAVIGEAGPEAVVPLHSTPGSSPLPSSWGGSPSSGSGGNTIIIQTGADPQQVITAVKQYLKRGGTL